MQSSYTFQYERVFFSIAVLKMIRIFVNPHTFFFGFPYGNLLRISPVDPCVSCKAKRNTYPFSDIQLMVNKRPKSLQSNLPLLHAHVNTLCLPNLVSGYTRLCSCHYHKVLSGKQVNQIVKIRIFSTVRYKVLKSVFHRSHRSGFRCLIPFSFW